jgi:hypothetical protein
MACARPAPTPPVAAREWGGCRVVVGAHRQQFWVGAARLKRNVEEWWQWSLEVITAVDEASWTLTDGGRSCNVDQPVL